MRPYSLSALFILLFSSIFILSTQVKADSPKPDYVVSTNSQIAAFIENKGQITDAEGISNPEIKFILNTPGLNIHLRSNGFSYEVYKNEEKATPGCIDAEVKLPWHEIQGCDSSTIRHSNRIDFTFSGMNQNASIHPEQKLGHYLNYHLAGTNVSGVQLYQKIVYKNIYPNIDVEFVITGDGSENQDSQTLGLAPGAMEFNFIIHPGGNPGDISLIYEGAEQILPDGSDQIRILTSLGEITETIPATYQLDSFGRRTENDLHTSYQVVDNLIAYQISGKINAEEILIIDPVPAINWATYYGGTGWDRIFAVNIDSQNNSLIAGSTTSGNNIATAGTHLQSHPGGDVAAYIAKLNASGIRLWGTYYGGNLTDRAYGMVLDSEDNIIITGVTSSQIGISTPGAFQEQAGFSGDGPGNCCDAFLAKFHSSGVIMWGTYFGGESNDNGKDVTIDNDGNIILVMSSHNNNLATTGTHQQFNAGWMDVILSKFSPDGNRIWTTYYGGSEFEFPTSVTTDSQNKIIVAGQTTSTSGISRVGAHQPEYGGGFHNAFLASFYTTGMLDWATYYGGLGYDEILDIAVSAQDYIAIAGEATSSSAIATPGAHQPEKHSGGITSGEAFIALFNPSGVRQWGTYYSGEKVYGEAGQYDRIYGIVFDVFNTIWVVGTTGSSTGIATENAFQPVYAGGLDILIAQFGFNGDLEYGSYLGGLYSDIAMSVAIDKTHRLVGAGRTRSFDMGVGDVHQIQRSGSIHDYEDGYLFKIITYAPPEPPVLLSPANGLEPVSPVPILVWEPAYNADFHDLQVAKDEDFNDIVFSVSGLSQSEFKVPFLGHKTTFYWRVRSHSAFGDGKWSEPWSFTTTRSGLPFFENFDDLPLTGFTMPEGWGTESTTGYDFIYKNFEPISPPAAVYIHNGSLAWNTDSWFFLPGLYFEKDVTYQVSFRYKLHYAWFPANLPTLTVYWGDSQLSTDMNPESISEITEFIDRNPRRKTGTFTPNKDGVYNIGFHEFLDTSSSSWIIIDDILVRVAPNVEIASSVIENPDAIIPVPGTGFELNADIQTAGEINFEYFDVPPVPGELPEGMESTANFYLNISSENVSFSSGLVSINLDDIDSNYPSPDNWLKRDAPGLPWTSIGGEIVDNILISTIPFSSFSEFTVSSLSSEFPELFSTNIKGNYQGWRMLASPVQNTTYNELLSGLWTQGFDGASYSEGFSNVYWFNESELKWEIPAHADNLIGSSVSEGVNTAGHGVLAWIYDDNNMDGVPNGWPKDISVFGQGNKNDLELNLSFTAGHGSAAGWHLISNPYPFTISWPKLVTNNDFNNVSETIHIWDANQNFGSGSFKINPGFTEHGLPEDIGFSGEIAPFQAFWVKATEELAMLTFRESQSADEETSIMAQGNEVMVSFELKGESYSDVFGIHFTGKEESSHGYKPFLLRNDYIQLFAKDIGNEAIVIYNLLQSGQQPEVQIPLYINATHRGIYTLEWKGLQNLPDHYSIQLEDLETGVSIELRNQIDYTIFIEQNIEQALMEKDNAPSISAAKISGIPRFKLTVFNEGEATTVRSAADIPSSYSLGQNYPNPYNPSTVINYALPEAGDVSLQVYNLLGQRVANLVNSYQTAGFYQVTFNGASLASGLYIYRLQVEHSGGTGAVNFVKTRKMMLVK